MRRTSLIFTGCALLLVLVAQPASAHPGLEPVAGRVGVAGTFSLVVDSHFPSSRVAIVDIGFPEAFVVDRVADTNGWVRSERPGGVVFRGDMGAAHAISFRITGKPTRKGITVFPVTTTSAAGESMVWTGSCLQPEAPFKGAMLFVDVDPGTACEPPADRSLFRNLGLGLVAAGLVLGAAYPVIRRSRERDSAEGAVTDP